MTKSEQTINIFRVLTDLEKNEILIEKGKNYENLPQENYQDNSLVPTFNSKNMYFIMFKSKASF